MSALVDAIDLAFAGIARQADLIAAGEISSRELVEVYLERIERLDPRLNAFRVVLAERALSESEQAAARRAAGEERPLLGVPIAIKDDVDVAGEVTTHGTAAHGGPAKHDAEVVRRLREAGAIVIGKTHVPELTIWPFTETPTFGVTRNPWNLDYAPGGSSGGSGAAVAAGLVGAALGSDGAGSIRIPSAWCGLFGVKPQRGRISMAPEPERWHGMATTGPIARSVIDAALFLDVASGTIAVDAASAPAPARPFVEAARTPPGALRIAYSAKLPPGVVARVDPQRRKAFEETVELLRSLGHTMVERDPDYGPATMPNLLGRYLRGIHDEGRKLPHPERLEPRTRSMIRIGGLIPGGAVARGRANEARLRARINAPLEGFDVLITPATAAGPPEIGRYAGRGALWTLNAVAGRVPYNGVWNLTGQPAAAVPAGWDERGLPLSVQLVGREGDESTLLGLAAQIEAERPWADRRPTFAQE